MIRVLILTLMIITSPLIANAKGCTGKFVNPISDICWKCLFPITIGKIQLMKSHLPDTKNPSSPVCVCASDKFPVPRPGISIGLWEPIRLIDVTPEPYCFVNLGGMKMNLGFTRDQGSRPTASSAQVSRWYVHYYSYPIISLLQFIIDELCFLKEEFDIAYISELDPMAMDDELSGIMNPEAFLFGNIIAQTACTFDCVRTSLNQLPTDSLFWCAGCQGTMYPLNAHANAHIGGVQASLNVAEKTVAKMHRFLLAKETSTDNVAKICNKRTNPIIKKSQYRYQMVFPKKSECRQFGRTTADIEVGVEKPIVGEDFGYLIWRKLNCCLL